MKERSEDILIMMEPGAQVSDEQLHKLDVDVELREGCEDVFIAGHLLAREQSTLDVEEELKNFKTHEKQIFDVSALFFLNSALDSLIKANIPINKELIKSMLEMGGD